MESKFFNVFRAAAPSTPKFNTLTAACATCGHIGYAPSAAVPPVDTLFYVFYI